MTFKEELSMGLTKDLRDEIDRLREALDVFGTHSGGCVAGECKQGRPTEDGGYETQYGYGTDEKWYQRGEYPECTCGLQEALNPEDK